VNTADGCAENRRVVPIEGALAKREPGYAPQIQTVHVARILMVRSEGGDGRASRAVSLHILS
jgi:hypothetical protein